MRGARHVRRFQDLDVYRKADGLARDIFRLSAEFPPEERHSLTRQIRFASRGIGANIAEAWAKRDYLRHFTAKLTDAGAEQRETEHWVHIAASCGYLSLEQAHDLGARLAEVGRMLHGMRRKAASFCPKRNGSR